MTTWIDGRELDGIKVEKEVGPRPGNAAWIPLDNPISFIIHTTEGSTVDGAVATLKSRFFAPHFVVGENRIVQMRPLDAQAATIHDWNSLGWQVECVGFASQKVHQLTPATWEPLVAVSRFVNDELRVPLRRPDGWKDDLSDIKTVLASNNTRRQSRDALTFHGFLGHLDIPDQDPTWHWDPGALDYTALFATLRGEEDKLIEDYTNGIDACQQKAKKADGSIVDPGPAPNDKPLYFRKGWSDERWRINNLKGRDGKDGVPGEKGDPGPIGDMGPPGDTAEIPVGTTLKIV